MAFQVFRDIVTAIWENSQLFLFHLHLKTILEDEFMQWRCAQWCCLQLTGASSIVPQVISLLINLIDNKQDFTFPKDQLVVSELGHFCCMISFLFRETYMVKQILMVFRRIIWHLFLQ